ncbi:MAG: serine protease [Kiritimatiellia bacterium]|jgi:S1-C subfamily serine protease|nr:serine protease [Kiritimatiellia bacterium]
MRRRREERYLLFVLVLIPFSLFGMGSRPRLTPASRPESKSTYLDSEQMLKTLSSELQTLHEGDRTTTMDVIRKQLSRKSCNAKLPVAAEPQESPVDLYEQNKGAVLVVGSLHKCGKCDNWHTRIASGFLVTADGVMITNYHVVDHPDTTVMGAMTHDGRVYPVKEVLAADEGGDIAVLQLEGDGFPYLSLSPKNHVGAGVSVISNPSKQFYTFTKGIISGRFVKTRNGSKIKRISVTADFGGGSSGAPVFNENGSVVGMVASTQAVRTNANCKHNYAQMVFKHCIPAELILELFAVE